MIRLRAAAPEDAPTLAEILVAAWRVAYRGLVPDAYLARLDPADRAKRLCDVLVSGEGETRVVEQDGRAVGLVTIGPCRDDDLAAALVGEIWGIYLAPAFWRRGIGTAACREAEKMLRSRGVRAIALWVFEGNEPARKFYEAMGFRVDGARKVIDVGASLPAIRYRKSLTREGDPLPRSVSSRPQGP